MQNYEKLNFLTDSLSLKYSAVYENRSLVRSRLFDTLVRGKSNCYGKLNVYALVDYLLLKMRIIPMMIRSTITTIAIKSGLKELLEVTVGGLGEVSVEVLEIV
ncbi:hypothetical protein HS7_12820 [Sulfolobales archaeon HS-7]|nr:hypothetical protein HS7_12820 [Sulfolobales archaeon HS-7]